MHRCRSRTRACTATRTPTQARTPTPIHPRTPIRIRTRTRSASVILTAICVALGGCAGSAGSSSRPARSQTQAATQASKLARARASHEYPSPPAPRQYAPGGAGSPVQALRAFTTTYINWTAQTVAAQMHALTAQSVGQARSAMALAAAQTAHDYELQRGGIANSGTVEAIAPLLGHREEYVVVTRELTSATDSTAYQGLRPAWHLTIATVIELGRGQWVLSGWQPEN